VHGIDASRIVCGFGSDDILHLLRRFIFGPATSCDEPVRLQRLGRSDQTRGASAEIVMAPGTDYRADVGEYPCDDNASYQGRAP